MHNCPVSLLGAARTAFASGALNAERPCLGRFSCRSARHRQNMHRALARTRCRSTRLRCDPRQIGKAPQQGRARARATRAALPQISAHLLRRIHGLAAADVSDIDERRPPLLAARSCMEGLCEVQAVLAGWGFKWAA